MNNIDNIKVKIIKPPYLENTFDDTGYYYSDMECINHYKSTTYKQTLSYMHKHPKEPISNAIFSGQEYCKVYGTESERRGYYLVKKQVEREIKTYYKNMGKIK